jgi:hypothetical protein
MRARLSFAVLSLSVSLLGACGGSSSGGGGGGGGTLPPIGTTGWTVLVYMTADNNLEGDALRDLLEMSSIDSGTDLRFVVQADRAAGEAAGAFVNVGDWTSTKRFVVRRGQAQNVSDLGEVNMGLSTSLSDFVTWGINTYPGERYMLVFWDHGGGWKGFGWDDSVLVAGVPDHLSLAEIATGIQTGLAANTKGVTKLDIIGFDACLMATIEVAEAMKPYANYLLASEEVEPGHGWDWSAFAGGGALTPAQLGTKIIDGFWTQAANAPWNDSAGVTLSLVDISPSKLGPIEAALTTLAGTYPNAGAIAGVLGTVAGGRQNAVEYAANPDPAQAYNLVDAWDLASKMPGVTGASALQTAIAGAVVYQRFGPAKDGSKGLSIYFPPTSANYSAEYDTLTGMDSWRTFLTAVYGGGANESDPFFVSGSYDTTAGLAITGTLDGATAGSARKAFLQYGIDFRDTGGVGGTVLLGDQPPSTFSGTTVASTWDWTVPILSQGAYFEMGYLSVEDAGSGVFTASFPFKYVDGGAGGFVVWQIAFNSTSIISDGFYLYSGGGVAQLAPAPGSTLHALIQWMPSVSAWSSTWELYDDLGAGFDATQPIDLAFAPLTAGTPVMALLRVENSAGAGDWIFTPKPPGILAP